jgi:hypothetical protein
MQIGQPEASNPGNFFISGGNLMARQTSVQLIEATERQVEVLKSLGFGTFTDIVRVAVDRMYQDESDKMSQVTATDTHVIENTLDETGQPFTVTFSDRSAMPMLGPYVDKGFSDKEEAIKHAQALQGMTFDGSDCIKSTLYNGMRVVWSSEAR